MRSVKRGWPLLLAAAMPLGAIPAASVAQEDDDEDELPDLEFLEYLGSWQDEDEKWYLEAELESDHKKDRHQRKRDEDEQE